MGYLKNKTFGFYLSFVAAILAADRLCNVPPGRTYRSLY